ncbi:creatine kinase B-type [Paramormyrops kingsleyae]|uniref:creatine kinase B-type n=1 Tax=Paramormyrops kingsleyae TaxID=1676925 RepID=UPI003B97BA4C
MWKIKPPIEHPLEVKYKPVLESRMPRDPMTLFRLKRLSAREEFPSLDGNYTWMGRILTPHMYERQFSRATESGVIFDDVIRPGLEEPGTPSGPMSVGCLAGDAQSYILFCDFFDRVIEGYHGYKITSSSQESDFNYDNLKGGDDLDGSYALGCSVSVRRSVDGFTFPTHCSRGERRRLYALASKALSQLDGEFPGHLYSLEELKDRKLAEGPVVPSSLLMRIGAARDWPDSRAVWVAKEDSLVVRINFEDHLRLVSEHSDSNIKKAFETVCINLQRLEVIYKQMRHEFIWKEHLGWVVSSPAEVGTGLRASVQVKLQRMARHKHLEDILERLRLRMDTTESSGVYRVMNAHTIGLTEVQIMQLLVDGVKLLIEMEKALKDPEGGIEHLVPTQK